MASADLFLRLWLEFRQATQIDSDQTHFLERWLVVMLPNGIWFDQAAWTDWSGVFVWCDVAFNTIIFGICWLYICHPCCQFFNLILATDETKQLEESFLMVDLHGFAQNRALGGKMHTSPCPPKKSCVSQRLCAGYPVTPWITFQQKWRLFLGSHLKSATFPRTPTWTKGGRSPSHVKNTTCSCPIRVLVQRSRSRREVFPEQSMHVPPPNPPQII